MDTHLETWTFYNNPRVIARIVNALEKSPNKTLTLTQLKKDAKIKNEEHLADCIATLNDRKRIKIGTTQAGTRFFRLLGQAEKQSTVGWKDEGTETKLGDLLYPRIIGNGRQDVRPVSCSA